MGEGVDLGHYVCTMGIKRCFQFLFSRPETALVDGLE